MPNAEAQIQNQIEEDGQEGHEEKEDARKALRVSPDQEFTLKATFVFVKSYR
jgi:hypothetical protein